MDDLDALLVDLQNSASAHVKNQNSPMVQPKQQQHSSPLRQQQPYHDQARPYPNSPVPQHQYHRQPQQQQHFDHGMQYRPTGSSRDSVNDSPPPPPVPPHPQHDEYVNDQQDYANGGCYDEDTQPIYEEQSVHRSQYSAPPTTQHQPPQRQSSSGLGHNLSELDSLLESLNSAQFMAEVEKKNMALMQPSPHPPPVPNMQQKAPEPKSSAASSATKDLDDLMASLSGINSNKADPHQSRAPSWQRPTDGPTDGPTKRLIESRARD